MRPLSIGPRDLSCYDAAKVRSGESVGNQEGVATQLLKLIVGKVRGVAFFHHPRNENTVSFLIQLHRGSMFFVLRPKGKRILAFRYLPVQLLRHLDLLLHRNMDQPLPELGTRSMG